MRRWAAVLLALAAATLRAEDRSPLSISLLASGAIPMGSGLSDYSDGAGLGARLRYEGWERWSSGVQWASYNFRADSMNDMTLQPITVLAQRRFGWGRKLVPYAHVS